MEVNPLLVMAVVVAILMVVARLVSFLGKILTELDKQARERMRELERQRRAMDGEQPPAGGRAEERQDLEQLFALLTGARPAQPPRARPSAPPPRPAPPRRAPPARSSLVPAPERHGGDLSAHHLQSRMQDDPFAPAAPPPPPPRAPERRFEIGGTDRHLEPTLSGMVEADQAAGSQATVQRAQEIAERLDQMPPVARGLLWSELLAPPLSRRGPRGQRGVRRV